MGMNAASSLVNPYEPLFGVVMFPKTSYLSSPTYIVLSPVNGPIAPPARPTSTSPLRVSLWPSNHGSNDL